MFQINRLPSQRIVDSFYHDEELGRYISEEFSLSIPDDFSNDTLYNGRRVKYAQSNGVLCMIIGREVITAYVLYHLIAGEYPQDLLDVEFGLLECMPYLSNQRTYQPDQYYLRHQFVDVLDSRTGEVTYCINKGQAMELLDCRRSLIYDLISPEYSSVIGYKGYYLRPHSETRYSLDDVELDNEDVGEVRGIYLMIRMDGESDVIVTGSAYGIIDTIAKSTDYPPTFKEVQEYFKVNDLESGFYGWKIRRIDDIHGINVRFTQAIDTLGTTL